MAGRGVESPLQIKELPEWNNPTNQTEFGPVRRFTLSNGLGYEVTLSSLGAAVTSIMVPDSEGRTEDVLLGFDNPNDYLGKGYQMGGTMGPREDGMDGGGDGFSVKNWQPNVQGESVVFSLHQPVGGNDSDRDGLMIASAKFQLSRTSGDLTVEYLAMSSVETSVKMAHRLNVNLGGHRAGAQTPFHYSAVQ